MIMHGLSEFFIEICSFGPNSVNCEGWMCKWIKCGCFAILPNLLDYAVPFVP